MPEDAPVTKATFPEKSVTVPSALDSFPTPVLVEPYWVRVSFPILDFVASAQSEPVTQSPRKPATQRAAE
jgi:hypothetical protein